MDANRFDRWTKALLTAGTRRSALRLSIGAAAGLAWLEFAEDAAACRKNGKKCKKSKQCCSKKCKAKSAAARRSKPSAPAPIRIMSVV
jgi:hypothetical protein